MRCRRIFLALTLLAQAAGLPFPSGLAAQSGLLTVAESSGFKATSRHADVMSFVTELQRSSPLIRVEWVPKP